jgi:hypothetical protein
MPGRLPSAIEAEAKKTKNSDVQIRETLIGSPLS